MLKIIYHKINLFQLNNYMEMNFKKFIFESEQKNMSDVNDTLNKIPEKFKKLIKNYDFEFESDNTLKGSSEYIGELDPSKKTIKVAAPWNYGREYAILHEIGHLVYEKYMTPKLKKQWSKIVKQTKEKQEQNSEELFCMAFANTYADSKIKIHDHESWEKFIKKLEK